MALLVGLDRLLLISRVSGLNGGWWREVDREDGRKVGETDIIPVSSFPPWGRFPQDCPCGCKHISVCTRRSAFLKLSVHTRTHCGLNSLTLSEPHKPQAMSEMCHALCLLQSHVYTGRAKPAWHTKGGERCYLVSKLSLCLTYISAPKPPRLSITQKKSLLPRERVLETPLISSALILHQAKGIEGDRKSYKRRMEGDGKRKKVTIKQQWIELWAGAANCAARFLLAFHPGIFSPFGVSLCMCVPNYIHPFNAP